MSPHSQQREAWIFRAVVDADRERRDPPPAKPVELGGLTKGGLHGLLLESSAALGPVET